MVQPSEDRHAPIDEGVIADEQSTIDLYFRTGLIKEKLDAKAIVDASFNGAIEKALRDATPASKSNKYRGPITSN